jgi:hypothetical protein
MFFVSNRMRSQLRLLFVPRLLNLLSAWSTSYTVRLASRTTAAMSRLSASSAAKSDYRTKAGADTDG